jgi:hypothetical protein
MGVSGQRHSPAALYPQDRASVPIGLEAGCASELVWTHKIEEKSFLSARDWTPFVQFIVSLNTDWATPAPTIRLGLHGMKQYWSRVVQQFCSI